VVEQLTSLMLGDSDVECARKALHALIAAAGFNALNERWGPHISAPDRAARRRPMCWWRWPQVHL
jgi:hypothetical protein